MRNFQEACDFRVQRELSQEEAAAMLGVSERTMRRWTERYEDGGVDALIDQRMGRSAHNEAPVHEVPQLVATYRERHERWSVRHCHDHYRDAGGTRSSSWVRKRLQEAGAVPKHTGRGRHRRRREPAPMPGMALHQDAGTHQWAPGVHWDLAVTMDDATNEIHSAFLRAGEGTASSLRGVAETIDARGLFRELRTDRGSRYWRTAQAGGKVDLDHPTHFKRALDRLGIHLEPACSPEARGRSERMFGTLQGRLPQELALVGITEMAAANTWLRGVHLSRRNRWFTRKARLDGETAFVPLVDPGLLDGLLCESHERLVGNDNCVSFEGMTLQIPAQPHRPTCRKVRVQVKRNPNGELSIWHGPGTLARHAPDGALPSATPPGQNRRAKHGTLKKLR